MTTMYFTGEDPDLTDAENDVRQRELDDDYLSVEYRGVGESDEGDNEETIVDLDAEFYGTGEHEDADGDTPMLPRRRTAGVAFEDLDHYGENENVSKKKRNKVRHGAPIQSSMASFMKKLPTTPELTQDLGPPIVMGEFRLVEPAISQLIETAIQTKELQQMLGGLTL